MKANKGLWVVLVMAGCGGAGGQMQIEQTAMDGGAADLTPIQSQGDQGSLDMLSMQDGNVLNPTTDMLTAPSPDLGGQPPADMTQSAPCGGLGQACCTSGTACTYGTQCMTESTGMCTNQPAICVDIVSNSGCGGYHQPCCVVGYNNYCVTIHDSTGVHASKCGYDSQNYGQRCILCN